MAVTETAAERRRAGACRIEVQALRGELRAARERAAREIDEQRVQLEADMRGRVAAAVATAESAANDRVTVLTAALSNSTTERAEGPKYETLERIRGRLDEEVQECTREIETVRCALAAREAELEAIVEVTAEFPRSTGVAGETCGGRGNYSVGSSALRGALAAATGARRAGCRVAELEKKCASLQAHEADGRADISRLRREWAEAKAAEVKAVGDAAATAAASQLSLHPTPGLVNETRDVNGAVVQENALQESAKAVVMAEDDLRQALAGAENAWRLITSCLMDEGTIDEDNLSANGLSISPATVTGIWKPSTDKGLAALVTGADALASAHRRRGKALHRAKTVVRAKGVCAREARRREAAQARARDDAEERLYHALTALDECERHRHHWKGDGGGNCGVAGGGRRGATGLSPEQEEHLRQIRSEVDRLEGQNQNLRQRLAGDNRIYEKAAVSNRDRDPGQLMSTQRMLLPRVVGGADEGRSDEAGEWDRPEWDLPEGLSGIEPASGGTPSPSRSWSAAKIHGSQWSPHQAGSGDRQEAAKVGGACAFESCTGCRAPHDDGSGGTLVPSWATEAE